MFQLASPAAPARTDTEAWVREPFLLTTSVYHADTPLQWPPHTHVEHELLWTERGIATMHVDGRQWAVTPSVGLFIPAGAEHEGSTRHHTEVRATYFDTSAWSKSWDHPVAVSLNPAVRELLIYLKRAQMSVDERVRAQQVCIDMLQLAEPVAFEVPLPQDPRLERLVDDVLRDPADDRSLEQWASILNMTSRTLTRTFAAEVAMSFARWRRLVRMHAAAAQLAGGTSIKVVARRVGYGSTSAFVAAFHKTLGCTPGELAERL